MATLAELARSQTDLEGPGLAHLQRLVASWGPLADLCFADLLLFVPLDTAGTEFVTVGHIRPTTNQTVYRQDVVGTIETDADRPLVARCYQTGDMVEGEVNLAAPMDRVRVLAIPVRWDGRVIGVCTQETTPSIGRQPGELEKIYVEVFLRFARMIAAGAFPFAAEDAESEDAPRVGDGAIVLDQEGRVEYASPNAVSALHRIGVHANAEGHAPLRARPRGGGGPDRLRHRRAGHRGDRARAGRHRAPAVSAPDRRRPHHRRPAARA